LIVHKKKIVQISKTHGLRKNKTPIIFKLFIKCMHNSFNNLNLNSIYIYMACAYKGHGQRLVNSKLF